MITQLESVAALWRSLDRAGIRHCIWKSTDRLADVLAGRTDIDLLVQSAMTVDEALREGGFVRWITPPHARHPHVADYFGLDTATGTLVHLHLHAKLVIGPHLFKTHVLEVDDAVLDTCCAKSGGARVPRPSLELLVLCARFGLKIATKRVLSRAAARRLARPLQREVAFLVKATEQVAAPGDGAHSAIESLAESVKCSIVEAGLTETLARDTLTRLKDLGLLNALCNPVKAGVSRAWRKIVWWAARAARRCDETWNVYGRRRPGQGVCVAIIGCDGAGKSSASREVAKWASRKLRVTRVYFGSGDGRMSLICLPFRLIRWIAKHGVRRPPTAQPSAKGEGRTTRPLRTDVYGASWACALAWDKYRKIRRCMSRVERGELVVCDRFPQRSVSGMCDGPMLGGWLDSPSWWRKKCARLEAAMFNKIVQYQPDLIIHLDVDVCSVMQRKSDISEVSADAHVRAMRAIVRSEGWKRVVRINANLAAEDVMRMTKAALWTCM